MKIVFVNEYCHPFVPGGAEESMMQLGRALVGRGHDVTVVTPNYGAPHDEVIDGIRIERFWFPKRIVEKRRTIRGWWHTSLFWWVASSIQVARAVRRLRPDVIHIHGKFSIPAGLFTGKLFGIRTIFTSRDYRAICNYGRCITEHKTSRRCSLWEYWTWEFPQYVREYAAATPWAWLVNALYALRGRLWSSFLRACVRRVDTVVCVSNAVERIYQANGIIRTTTIYNIQPQLAFSGNDGRHFGKNEQGEVLYIGKLSPGKGAGLLPEVIAGTVARNPAIRWTLYTNGGVLEKKVREDLAYFITQGFVDIRAYVAHEVLLNHIAESAVVFIPSVWHEPLTRLALESLQSGTPVVVTDRGGSPEIVANGITGRVAAAEAGELADAVLDVVQNQDAYRARIQEQQANLTNTFCVQPIEQHRALYESMVARRAPKRTLGVILPPGGSLRVLDEHGQKSRYMIYLAHYAKHFDQVFLFSYEPESGADLPDGVTLIAPKRAISKRRYMFLMPFVQRQYIQQCSVLRVMQMDGCVPAVLARWFYRVPFVATFGYKYAEFALLKNRLALSKIMRWIEALGARTATAIIFTTEELRIYLLKRFGPWVGPKLLPIPNGVDTRQFAEGHDRDPHTLLFVGRLEEQKNLFALLEAVAQLPERGSLRLVWIGRGSLEGALRQRARELGVSLEIIPRVDNADLPPYYQKAGVFTLVSLIEGMPKALIEAMSAGCPCVVSDCDGNGILIENDVTGLVVGTDAKSIAAGLARMLGDETLRRRLGGAAREKVVAHHDLRRLLEMETEHLLAIGERESTLAKTEDAVYDTGLAEDPMEHTPKKALITGRTLIKIDPRYYRPTEVDALQGDAGKAKRVLGFEPKTSFDELTRIMMEHHLKKYGLSLPPSAVFSQSVVSSPSVSMAKDAKIYVAGHRGLVGSAIVRNLEAQGYTNIVKRTHEELNLCDERAVAAFFEQEKPEYVFLAAAKVGGIVANQDAKAEMFYDNMAIELNVIHHAWKNGVKKLVFLGSSCIYPKLAQQPIKEEYLMTGHLEPTNDAYAVAKIAGIQMCRAYYEQYGFKSVSVMPCNLFGTGDNFDLKTSHVLPGLLRKVVEAKERGDTQIVMWGTGTPRREFLYVDDVADACVFLMNSAVENEIFNIGMGEDIAVKDLLQLICEIVGYHGEIAQDLTKPDGTPRKLLDMSRLHALGWKHRVSLREGIERLLAWFLANRQGA